MKRFGRAVKQKLGKGKKVGLFVDGSLLVFKDRAINGLKRLKEPIEELGSIRVSRIFFDSQVNDKVIDKVVDAGFSPIMLAGDIDLHMAIDVLECVLENKIDIVALVTNDLNQMPILSYTRQEGKETVVIMNSKSPNKSLESFADVIIFYDLLEDNLNDNED